MSPRPGAWLLLGFGFGCDGHEPAAADTRPVAAAEIRPVAATEPAAPVPTAKAYSTRTQLVEVPEVELVDRHGERVSATSALAGPGPVFVQFIFTTCSTTCPVLSANFTAAQAELSADARLVSISIDPEHDTPARLAEYAARHHADERWHMYTGNHSDIVALQNAFEVYRGNKMRHDPVTFIRQGDRWLRIEGFISAARLVAEQRALSGS